MEHTENVFKETEGERELGKGGGRSEGGSVMFCLVVDAIKHKK